MVNSFKVRWLCAGKISQDLAAGEPFSLSINDPGHGTILYAEDEACVRKVTRAMLEKLGYDVLMAKDGVEAIDVFNENAHFICLVISDLDMPRLNGLEVLAAIQSKRPEIPVVLTSGYIEIEDMTQNETDRHRLLLSKPYTFATLRCTLEYAFGEVFDSSTNATPSGAVFSSR